MAKTEDILSDFLFLLAQCLRVTLSLFVSNSVEQSNRGYHGITHAPALSRSDRMVRLIPRVLPRPVTHPATMTE